MSTIRIDIYDPNDKNRVENTYTAEGYDLMMGTLEDFISIIYQSYPNHFVYTQFSKSAFI